VSIINSESKDNCLCVVKVEKPWGLSSWSRTNLGELDGCIVFILLYYMLVLFISSPFLFVFGNDHVICYTGADDNTSYAGDA